MLTAGDKLWTVITNQNKPLEISEQDAILIHLLQRRDQSEVYIETLERFGARIASKIKSGD